MDVMEEEIAIPSSFLPLCLVLFDCHLHCKYRWMYMFLLLLVVLELFGSISECSDRFGPLDLEDLVLRNLVVHPDSFKLYCHLSVTILMQCPVIVSMLIRTRMSSICLQIGILLVCSWSLWGVSFNPGDLNARSKLRTPNSFKMVYFWCPIYTMGELKIQLLMIPLLNFSTLRPVSYDRKEEKHCLANSCFTCVSMS